VHFDWTLFARYSAPLVTLLAGIALDRWLERRPKLLTYLAHASAVQVKPPEGAAFQVNTHSVVVRNAGRKPATNVRLSHIVLPNFSVYPAVKYEVVDLPGGAKEILFPILVPGEQVTIAYLYAPPVFVNNVNTQTKSDEGFAKVLTVLPKPQPGPALRWSAVILMVIGGTTVIYAVTEGISYVWSLLHHG
jgi:hypothetical protein